MALKPLEGKVVVEVIDTEVTTVQGGIIMPGTVQEVPNTATVVAVCRGENPFKPGDKVMFNKFSGAEVKDGDKLLTIMSVHDIIGVIEE